ncbi:MAG: hypothetical protein LBJ65_19800 [Burkholderia sp.]|jgi:hypothetical protein|uniref:hypothetical protein n=1 Tax=Burkholderia sp. TaxID=36773 RepID=UPI00282517EC|nr:hypothetical protein [Burkholderia sp.]MDR0243844.1 hypothetical protein [Burkholderia sp.]
MSSEQKPPTHPFATVGSFDCCDGVGDLTRSGLTVARLSVDCVSNVVRYVDGRTNGTTVWDVVDYDDFKRLTIIEKQFDSGDVGAGVAARERLASGCGLTAAKHPRAMRRSEAT